MVRILRFHGGGVGANLRGLKILQAARSRKRENREKNGKEEKKKKGGREKVKKRELRIGQREEGAI